MKGSKRFLALATAFSMVAAIVPQSLVVSAAETEYKIYPTPHSITYEDKAFYVEETVSVTLEDGIDEVTESKLSNVLSSYGVSEEADKDVKILVGVYGSGGSVDAYAEENITFDAATFDHYDSYVLDVDADNDTITILGKDTDAAFYGVVSLMHIFNQSPELRVRDLTIEDYADTSIRGFIEGYYGIPWSNEDRMSLMEFGGQFKMTSYVFAPKDDPYHTSKWRDLYPEEEINAIAEMVEVGNVNKCRFVWTAHPFMGGFNTSDVDGEIESLLAKFDQLYSVGVRQFGVLGDDVGSLDRTVVIQVMTAVSEWANEKGDVYDSVFCPAGYNHSWQGDYSELNDYDAGFPDDVQIFWTGQAVCQPVEQTTLDNFRNYNATNGERRSPLFWLNWPVNDINMSRLMMGKGSLLHTDVNVDDLVGVVTNPMQDAEASKVAIFAVADYAWNVADFDDDQSWADSFAYIDADASEELHTLAKHMSDPSPNGHGLVLAESEELAPLMDAYKAKLEAGTATEADHAAMIAEFEIIAEACDAFHEKSQNEKLKEELLPFTSSLKDQALSAIAFINTSKAIETGDASEVWTYYSQAAALLTSSQNHMRETLSGTQAALPGSKYITPFVNDLSNLLSPTVMTMIDDSKQVVTLITSRTDTPSGALEKLTDNKESTEVIWSSPNSTTAGTYIGLTYSKAITLNEVTFKMGQSNNDADTFDAGKLQYTVDGKEWIDIEGTEFTTRVNNVTATGLDLEVKGIRIISTADKTNMWLGCKDIVVNGGMTDDSSAAVSGTGIYNTENMGVETGNVGMFTDGSTSDYAGFGYVDGGDYTVADAWVGIEFAQTETIGYVEVVQGSGDHIDEGTLEYLNENDEWVEIGTYTGIGQTFTASFNKVQAKAVRLINNAEKAIWWRIYEFTVMEKQAQQEGSVLPMTPFDSGKGVYDGSLSNVVDGNESTYIWYSSNASAGDYIGVDLGESYKLGEIKVVMDSGDYWTNYDLQYSADGTNYTTYGSYTGATLEEDLSIEDIEARYVRLYNTAATSKWTKIFEFSVGEQIIRTDAIFTNLPTLPTLSIKMGVDEAVLSGATDITLAPGQYIGIVLDRIKDITNITVTGADGLALETSKNNVVWTSAEALSEYEDARYIRLINNTDTDITINFGELNVQSFEIEPISVEETTFGNASTHVYAFDKDRTTEAVLQASQNAGQFITYDLGQEITLESLKLVLHDGTTDYPRHAKVSVSLDGENWTDVMLIGNQDSVNEGEAENTDDISDLFPVHEISYYTLEETGIDQEVRYIKFEITRTKEGADKWVRIREIEINGGDMYMATENNPTIIVDGAESDGNIPSNMIDEDVLSTFKSANDEAGSFTYYLSEDTNVKKVTILQSPATISNAEVTAEVVKDGNVEIIRLGSLSSSLVAYNTSAYDHVLSITVTWEAGNVPEIHEIIAATEGTGGSDPEPAPTPDPVENPFVDVNESHYFYDAVLWAVGNNITSGLTATRFGTGQECTREQVVTFLWRAAGQPEATAASCAFTDVKANGYYYDAVLWAVENNITSGLTATKFGTGETCTREQVVTFLWRAAGQPEATATSCTFTDVDVNDYYYNALLWATENGIVAGLNANEFGVGAFCTREQVVTFLYRYDSVLA